MSASIRFRFASSIRKFRHTPATQARCLDSAMDRWSGKRTSVLWDRGGAEFISAFVSKGTVNVDFAYNEFASDKAIRERARKGAKDF